MTITSQTRAEVRATYAYACAYCGVPETLIGSELEVDHFRPLSSGGTDDADNLVYACTTCNRFKSDYWPAQDAPESFRLIHPGVDDVSSHIIISENGDAIGITARGWFHIRWLHLNRPQLVEVRRHMQAETRLRESLAQAESARDNLRRRIADLESELAQLRSLIARLTSE